ncbi:LysR substrate-binding domain-containing protein [Nonlabens tegetincola]|uniref:LysR substrate-binding domain-containing protein n=1 Tax=Nonlabens tegetincola TaxID=323273 RepID=UPI0030C8C7D3
MNIQQFKYILAVVDLRNFEAAADKCFVSQSTLSTMIARFEDEIGIKIFNRKSKPVSVTREGAIIVERLRTINNDIGLLGALVKELKGELMGELKIGVIPTIAPYLLPLFLHKFATKFPYVNLIVDELQTDEIVAAIKNRSLDIGLLALPIKDKDLNEKELFVEPFLIYDCREKSTEGPISIKNLDYSKLWLLKQGHCLQTQVHQICEQSSRQVDEDSNLEFRSGSLDGLIRFTKASNGLTILPQIATLDFTEHDQGKLVHFDTPVPSRSVGIITHKYFVKKTLLNKLQLMIQDIMKEVISEIPENKIIHPLE